MSDKPCASCPWLRDNQTPKAVADSPVDARGVHWFAVSNLKSRWRFVARGGMLPCHMTDRNAPNYGGKPTSAEEGRVCVGLTVLAKRELYEFMKCGMNPERYKKTGGMRFSVKALAMWASMLHYVGATLGINGSTLRIPQAEVDDRVVTPWGDPVHNSPQEIV